MTRLGSGPFRRTFRGFQNRNYRLFWFGQFVSLSGSWMQRVAQAWLVLQLTDSPFALGMVSALQFIPLLLLSLFGGVFADRLPKRRLLLTSQSIMTCQALAIAILTTTGLIQLWHIYLLAAVLGLASAIDNPTRQAFVVEMVGSEDVSNAVALNSSLQNGTRIVGPAVAGAIIGLAGVAACFWLNALSYLAVIGALLAMRSADFYGTASKPGGRLLSQLREGLAYAVRTREICLTAILLFALGSFGYNYNVILPLLARYVLGVGPFGLGVLFSCLGAGSVATALGLASRRRATERTLLRGAAAFAGLLFLVALSPWFALTAGLLVFLGAAGITFSATANTRMQLAAPPELRGRVMGLHTLLFVGTTPLGAFLVGTLSERFGVQQAVATCAGLCALGLVAALAYSRQAAPAAGEAADRAQPASAVEGARLG